MAKVKLVKGASYSHPFISGGEILQLGQSGEVAPEHLEEVLDLHYFDASNNKHCYFERAAAAKKQAAPVVEEDEEEEGDDPADEAGSDLPEGDDTPEAPAEDAPADEDVEEPAEEPAKATRSRSRTKASK